MPASLLQPIRLPGGRGLPDRLLPGPMDGITEHAFLTAMSRRGWCHAWITPFLRISTGVPRLARLREWLDPYLATGLPVIAQVMGTSTERLAATAARLSQLGAQGVDLNCACPSPTVIGNHSGGARLREPDWIARTLLAMKDACGDFPISLKIRFGFERTDEFPAICEAVRAARPDMTTIHFRTVAEGYRPVADGLERLRQARSLLPGLFLVGSGDLFTPADIIRMHETTGVEAVAPARGLLSRPSLLAETAAMLRGEPSPTLTDADKLAFLLDLADPAGLPPGTRNGFVLRMTRSLFGEDSALFARLRTLPSLRATRAELAAWRAKEGVTVS